MEKLKNLLLLLQNKWDDLCWNFRFRFPIKQLRDVKYWIRHRTIDRYDIIKIPSLEFGYHDKDNIMLHGIFALLVDYVESELAWMNLICNVEEMKKIPWYMSAKRYRNKHAKRLGLDHLDWQMQLRQEVDQNGVPNKGRLQSRKKGTQGWAGKEIKELYLWWTKERDEELKLVNEALYDNVNKDLWFERDTALHNKEEAMCIRLMKVRGHLWT